MKAYSVKAFRISASVPFRGSIRNCNVMRVRLVVFAAATALLLPTLAAAQVATIQLTATDVFDPYGLFSSTPVGAFLSSGTVTCPGTQATGNPMQPCPPGSRMNFRDVSWKSRVMSPSALLTGWFYSEGNNNLDADATGPVWGTFRIELDAGGVWEGGWTADRSKTESVWIVRARGIGRGKGGSVDGMHLQFTEVAPTPAFMPIVYLGSMDAEILVPPSR